MFFAWWWKFFFCCYFWRNILFGDWLLFFFFVSFQISKWWCWKWSYYSKFESTHILCWTKNEKLFRKYALICPAGFRSLQGASFYDFISLPQSHRICDSQFHHPISSCFYWESESISGSEVCINSILFLILSREIMQCPKNKDTWRYRWIPVLKAGS